MGGVPGSTLILGAILLLDRNCIGFSPQFHAFYRAILVHFRPFDLAFVDSPASSRSRPLVRDHLSRGCRGPARSSIRTHTRATPFQMVGGPRERTCSYFTLQASLPLMLYPYSY